MKKLALTYVAIFLSVASVNATALTSSEVDLGRYTRENAEGKSLALISKDINLENKAEEEQQHVPTGDRAESHEAYVQRQEARVNAQQEEKVAEEEAVAPKSLMTVESEAEDEELLAKKLYYTSHEGAYHRAVAVTFIGDQVTLEDGSVWSVASFDRWKTLDWLTSDTILVAQNKWYFSSYKFMLINQNTGREVEVNMALGPVYAGYYTYWVTGVDYISGNIYLNDGSIWQISAFDYSIMDSWLVNDTVIIGVNESSSIFNPNILINVNMLNYVRGNSLN